MDQLHAGIKSPRRRAGILSCRITLIAAGLRSRRVAVCFNFYRVCVAAPSPRSPSALMLRQTPNNSSLTCYQTASLIPFPSLKGLCQMDKRPVWCGELSTSPFPTLSLTKLLRSPAPDVMLHSPNPKPASQPLLRRVPATFICKAESPAVGGEKL